MILSAGLIFSLFQGWEVKLFFLVSVTIAGIFGAVTVSRRIFFIQALPALVTLSLLLLEIVYIG